MKPNDFFSIKDFFNYYLAGLIWLLDFIALGVALSKPSDYEIIISSINTLIGSINTIVATIAIIVIPYLLGFLLNPVCTQLMQWVRNHFNEAIRWVTDPEHRLSKQGLKEWEKEIIITKVKKLYRVQDKNFDELFFTIRAYVEEHGKGASLLASRALDLTNFAESLIIPLPTLFFIVGVCFLIAKSYYWAILLLGVGIAVLYFIIRRYLDLRSYWVKHVYRAFIAINND